MGGAKKLYMMYLDRGFGKVDEKNVCVNCFDEYGLQQYIKEHGKEGECSYCDELSTVISLEDIICHIQNSLHGEYTTPEESGTPYESREGGWFVEPCDVTEILCHEPLYEIHDDLYEDIISALNDNYYLPYFTGDDSDRLNQSWYDFTNIIKHKSRFLFFNDNNDGYSRYIWEESRNILNEIKNILSENKIVKTLPAGDFFYRVRLSIDGTTKMDAKSLGTVPIKYANNENRMSPAGIPMFYCSEKLKTAIIEANISNNIYYHSAKFVSSRDIVVADLSTEIFIPSIYDEHKSHDRYSLKFMRGFVRDISKQIIKDDKHHIEYIPTQLVAEYLRYNFIYNNTNIDGIMYKSSVDDGGLSYALFVENDNCIDICEPHDENKLYLLCQCTQKGLIKNILKT